MDDVLKQVYNACDPFEPASAEFYVDCAAARGSGALEQEFMRRLELTTHGHLRFLFSGHIGCGKSSELAVLKRHLENPQNGSRERYFTVLINTDDYLDDFDVTPTDILLAIVTEMATVLREEANIEIRDSYFKNLWGEIKDVLFADVEISDAEVTLAPSFFGTKLGEVKTKVQLLKRDPNARNIVRKKLAPRLSSLREEINNFLTESRIQIKKLTPPVGQPPYKDIVLILDNLEKIHRVDGKGEGVSSQREMFVERAPQLTGLQTHVIYTIPLRLARADAPLLQQRYGKEPFVLPMVKVRDRNRHSNTKGLDFLKDLIQKRLNTHRIDEVFETQALDFLLLYSGGHIRNLMIFVQNACAYTETMPISMKAAREAIEQTMRSYAMSIHDAHWAKLAALHLSPTQHMPSDDSDYLEMLENLSVLEYINGDCDSIIVATDPLDPFPIDDRHIAPWYAVNPIVTQLSRFKEEVTKLRNGQS